MFTSLRKLVLLPFLEFNSLIRLGNWFHCLLLLMHICSKTYNRTEKRRGKSGITLSLFDTPILNENPVEDASFGLIVVLFVRSIRESSRWVF